MTENMEKEVRPGLRDKIGSKAKQVGLAVGGTIAAVAISCAPGAGRTENPAPSSPTVPTASGEPLNPPTPTSETSSIVIPPAAPTPEPTPEIKPAVPCQILPPEVCAKAELVDRIDRQGKEYKAIGVNVPSGVPIRSPRSGNIVRINPENDLSGLEGSRAAVVTPDTPPIGFSFAGDLRLDIFPSGVNQIKINEGDIIGYTQDTGIKNSGYNLVILIVRSNHGAGESSIPPDVLKQYF